MSSLHPHVPPARRALLFVACLFAIAATAHAQQPFRTDDADVTPKGHVHFEFSNEFDVLQKRLYPNLRQNTADFELDYGLTKRLEVGIEAPFILISNAREFHPRAIFGLGDTNLSAKFNLWREREDSRLPAVTVAFNLEVPTGSVSRQLGSGLADYYLNSILQKSLTRRTKLRANGGVLFSGNTTTGVVGIRTRGTVYTGATSLVRQFTPRLTLGAEVTGALARNFALTKGQLQGQLGGNFALRKNCTLDFGLISGRYSASPRLGAQFGLSVDF